jgi:hypothetical protein
LAARRLPVAGGGLVLAATFLLLVPCRLAAAGDTCDGVRFPQRVRVGDVQLVRNGVGIRRATIFNVHVYVAALYVAKRSRRAADLLKGGSPWSLTLHLTRDVSREEMAEALDDGMKENAPRLAAGLRAERRRLATMLPALKEGKELTFQHLPGQGLTVLGGSKRMGRIDSDAFADAILRIWLGPHPPDDDLKAGLLGGKCD